MSLPPTLCVYCGSSSGTDPSHDACAADVGRTAARRGVRVVFGGGHVGLMGTLADAALHEGGEVVGIIPTSLMEQEVGHDKLTGLEVVDSMHTRKARMETLSDAFCALPGGFGTLDELFEIVTWRQLGFHDKPIFLVDFNGFWQPLVTVIEHQVTHGFVKREAADLITVVSSVYELFDRLAKLGLASEPR